MAKKIKLISTVDLVNYQQTLDFGSRQLHGLFQEIDKAFKEGILSRDFYEKMEKGFSERIRKNNIVSSDIDTEIFTRIQSNFGGGLTTMKEIPRFGALFAEEQKRFAAEKEKKEAELIKKTKKLKLIPSSETKK